ncbi:MAG TPA: hypothetical protein VN843_35110, partial [Anaerolineales bacterium]|nr:hypothetical protein [Anaerolineales bacterium]
SESYPNGLFVTEAHEHRAVVLTGLAKEQTSQKEYAEALGNLALILKDYGDTSVAEDAAGLNIEAYTAWGTDLRKAGNFEGAEKVFNEFRAWTESNQKTEYTSAAQREISQTYLDWGLALQSQKQFEAAKAKLEMAVMTDPEQASSSGTAAEVKANQTKFYGEWGDYLVEQTDFARAIEQYETAVSLSDDKNQPAAKDAVANGYIQWAIGLSAEEDFLGAQRQLELAREKAITGSMKKSVDDARQDVYIAFSKSSGEQAQQAMKDAAKIVCDQHKMPSLPIFGVDQEKFLVGINGVDESLPKNVVATTPGEMHYVACIEEDSKIVESVIHTESSYFFNPNPPYTKIKVEFNRIQYFWTVTLRKVDTGKEVESTMVEGKDPPPFPTDPWEIAAAVTSPQYFGPKPDLADLAEWLLLVIE